MSLNTPLPAGTGRLTQQIHDIRRELRRMQARRTPGILTSITPGGVTRRPLDQPGSAAGASSTSVIPRWG